MLKEIIVTAAIAGAISLAGALLHDLADMRDLGRFILGAGVVYGFLSVGLILFKQGIPLLNKAASERETTKAHNDLLKYKKLLDEGILTQDEFDKKAQELKSKIL